MWRSSLINLVPIRASISSFFALLLATVSCWAESFPPELIDLTLSEPQLTYVFPPGPFQTEDFVFDGQVTFSLRQDSCDPPTLYLNWSDDGKNPIPAIVTSVCQPQIWGACLAPGTTGAGGPLSKDVNYSAVVFTDLEFTFGCLNCLAYPAIVLPPPVHQFIIAQLADPYNPMLTSEGKTFKWNKVRGVDVSYANPESDTLKNITKEVDWKEVLDNGNSFAYVRATQASLIADFALQTNIKGALGKGLIVGVYHLAGLGCCDNVKVDYSNPESAYDEAAFFLEHATSFIGTKFLPPALDLEYSTFTNDRADPSEWVANWLRYVWKATHVQPIIYINEAKYSLLSEDIRKTYRFWIVAWDKRPEYVPRSYPKDPKITAELKFRWLFKQYRSPDPEKGSTDLNHIDWDSFNGLHADLSQLSVLTQIPNKLPRSDGISCFFDDFSGIRVRELPDSQLQSRAL